jgi:hypothetical protein
VAIRRNTPSLSIPNAERVREQLKASPLLDADPGDDLRLDADLVRALETMPQGVTDSNTDILPATGDTSADSTPRTASAKTSDLFTLAELEQRVTRLENEAAAASSSRRAALLLYEAGRIVESWLEEPERAIGYYRASHERYAGLAVNARALARLLHRLGDHTGSIRALDAELVAATGSSERSALLTQRGLRRLYLLGDIEGARLDLQQALEIDTDDPAAVDVLCEINRQRDPAQSARLLRERIRRYDDPRLLSAMLCEAADLLSSGEEVDQTAAVYRSALNAAPENTDALRASMAMAKRRQDYPALVRLARALADQQPPTLAAATLDEATTLALSELRNLELGIETLEHALSRAADDHSLLWRLAELLERDRRWEELAKTYERIVAITRSPNQAARVRHMLAKVYLERLQDGEKAIETLILAVEQAPEHVETRAMLGRLFAKNERYDDLLEMLHKELDRFTDATRRAATAYRIGDLLERHKPDQQDKAILAYKQALELLPGYRPALRGLSRALGTQGNYEQLVEIFKGELEAAQSREDRIQILLRIADLQEHELHDDDEALKSYEQLVVLDPKLPAALQGRRRILSRKKQWSTLAVALRAEAEITDAPWRRVKLLYDAGALLEEPLGLVDEALATYQEVLERQPDYLPALMSAGRILAARNDHAGLLALHQRELAASENAAHRTWLLVKIGRILDEHLGKPQAAIAAYRQALDQNVSTATAADLLLDLYERCDMHAEWADLKSRQKEADIKVVRGLDRRLIARKWLAAGRQSSANSNMRQAVDLSDGLAPWELSTLFAESGDRKGLVALWRLQLERSDNQRQRLEALHGLALAWLGSEHELHRTHDVLGRILHETPYARISLRQLETVSARLERWREVAAALELSRSRCDDEDLEQAIALLEAAIHEHRLEDSAIAAQYAKEVLDRYPNHPEALESLEVHSRATRQRDALLQVVSRRLRGAQTASEQAAELCSMASLHATNGELSRALEFYRMAAEQANDYLPAVRGWYRAASELDDPLQMALALEQEAQASRDPARRMDCDLEAARVWEEEADDGARAVKAYRRVLMIEPIEKRSLDRLEALYRASGQYRDLVDLFDHRVENETDSEAQRALLTEMAEMQRKNLHDLLGARRTINRAIRLAPDDIQLLSTLAELCRASEDWSALSKVNKRLLRQSNDPVLLKAIHFEQGLLWEEKLADPSRAMIEYRQVLNHDDADVGSLQRLSELLVSASSWDEALDITERLIHHDDDRERIRSYHLRLAEIQTRGFGDIQAAIACCRRALALDPGDMQASDRMAQLLEKSGDTRGLHAHLESTLGVHRSRLEGSPFLVPSYRALERAFARRKDPDAVFVVRTLLCGIDAATRRDYDNVKAQRKHLSFEPARALTDQELSRILPHPEDRGALRALLAAAEHGLRKIYGREERKGALTRVTARTNRDLYGLIRNINATLGNSKIEIWERAGGVEQLAVLDTSPPTLVVGSDLGEISEAELRFRVARLLARIRVRHVFSFRLGAEQLAVTVRALISLTTSFEAESPSAAVEQLRLKLERVLGKRARANMQQAALELADREIAPQRWFSAMEQTEDRIALAASGDLLAGIEAIKSDEITVENAPSRGLLERHAGPRLRHLLSFAVSEEFLGLRDRLGLAVTTLPESEP